ncbi:MAG TPA: ribonucleoside triphosphate reductase, partial [Algoriphagus sp.]
MEQYVIKRNGEYEPFASFKIEDALKKGFHSVSEVYDSVVFDRILRNLASKTTWAVEEIQDLIEKELFQSGYFQVMRSFMLYRHTRKLQREHVAGLNDDTTYVDSTQTIEEYIQQTDWRINANANTSYSNAGLVNNVAGKIIANYWLDK